MFVLLKLSVNDVQERSRTNHRTNDNDDDLVVVVDDEGEDMIDC